MGLGVETVTVEQPAKPAYGDYFCDHSDRDQPKWGRMPPAESHRIDAMIPADSKALFAITASISVANA